MFTHTVCRVVPSKSWRASFLAPNDLQMIRVVFDACKVVVGRYQYLDVAAMMRKFRPFADAKVALCGHSSPFTWSPHDIPL